MLKITDKRFFCVVFCIFNLSVPLFSESEPDTHSPVSALVGVSWDASVYGSMEWMFSSQWGLRTAVGTSLFLPLFIADESFYLSSELTAVYIPGFFLHKPGSFYWGISGGIPHMAGVWYRDEETDERSFEAVTAAGISGLVAWTLNSGHELRLWVGGGYPFFYENGWETRDISFPLNVWPILKAELKF